MKNIHTYQIEDTASYPVGASLLGTNAYYLEYCGMGGHRPAYAACLNRVSAVKNGASLGANCTECSSAINVRSCPAIALREEELEAGRALYYINRAKQQEFNERLLGRQGITVNHAPLNNKIMVSLSTEFKSKSAAAPASGSVYADAINKAIASGLAKDASQPTSAAVSFENKVSADLISAVKEPASPRSNKVPKFESGLSLEQIAQRMKAKA
jgi:hypothetical protein